MLSGFHPICFTRFAISCRWLVVPGALVGMGLLVGVLLLLPGGRRQQGLQLAGQGKYAEAEPLLAQVLEANPDDVELLRPLALVKIATANGKRCAEAVPYPAPKGSQENHENAGEC